MDKQRLESILTALGEQVPPGSQLYLLGGGALTLLGSPRPSFDIDFVGDDVQPSELHRKIMEKAKEMDLQVDAVPIDRFITYRLKSWSTSSKTLWRRLANLISIPIFLCIWKN
ncbi:MAG: hypothetical protein AB1509_09015 [Chloroflexota bacterium]